jgi:hypothetical protein
MTRPATWGKRLQDRLLTNLRAYEYGPATNDRALIPGVTHYGVLVRGQTMDTFLTRAGTILLDSRRVYRWEDTLVFESHHGDEQRLELLATQYRPEPQASAVLTNLFTVGVAGPEGDQQSVPPAALVKALLASEGVRRRLPALRYYARRPLFDQDFNLCGPGWHPGQGILVHGLDITPALEAPHVAGDAPALEGLPPHLRRLLQDFCWASDADLANAVGLLLTGLLANHFVDDAKPVVILDGNQRGVGKTLLCQVVGRVLDGVEPRRLPLVRDEELEKKLCAAIKDGSSSVLFFDNVRTRIESALIEANALSPVLSFRILGKNENVTRPNTFLWLITSNQASGTEDLISRAMPIRLRYEGNPRQRTFREEPLAYATRRRQEILSELAGLVLRWKEAGMPAGAQQHRCGRWAQVIGGILCCAGLDQFLTNVEEAEAVMDEGLQALATVAEYVVTKQLTNLFMSDAEASAKDKGAVAKDWIPCFREAEVYRDVLEGRNPKGRETFVGQFLSGKVERPVAIQMPGGSASATLRVEKVRGNRKRYFFVITANPGDIEGDGTAGPADAGSGRTDDGAGVAPRGPTPLPAVATAAPSPPPAATGTGNTLPHAEGTVGNSLEWV